jgi:hypothetical protein
MITADHIIVVDDDPHESMQVSCLPFEPQFAGYAGERLLRILYRGEEESFVVLSAAQASKLAQLLTEEVRW